MNLHCQQRVDDLFYSYMLIYNLFNAIQYIIRDGDVYI